MTLPGIPPDSDEDAPLFRLFWENGALNSARGALLGERIARDSAQPYVAPRPVLGAAAAPLPAPASPLAPLWRARTSGRAFDRAPLPLQALSDLLAPLAARSSTEDSTRLLPSGGGKYPILVYAALCNIADAPQLNGHLAWYDPIAHGLAPMGSCPPWPVLRELLGVEWPQAPAAVCFMVARGEGMLRKYGERGGRFILLEAGAYMAALSLQAAQAGLAGCAIGSFHDARVLSLLQLDTRDHLAVLAYACGAPAPDRV